MKFIILLIAVLFASPVFANDYENGIKSTELYRLLNRTYSEGGIVKVNPILGKIKTSKDIEIVALWARDIYHSPERNPRIGIAYADSMMRIANGYKAAGKRDAYNSLMNTGAESYFSSKLIAYEDLNRCVDKTSGRAYLKNWSGELETAYKNHFASLNDTIKNAMWREIDNLERIQDSRPADVDVCRSGVKALSKSIAEGMCREGPDDPATLGKDMVCEGTGAVNVLNGAEWQKARLTAKQEFKEYLFK